MNEKYFKKIDLIQKIIDHYEELPLNQIYRILQNNLQIQLYILKTMIEENQKPSLLFYFIVNNSQLRVNSFRLILFSSQTRNHPNEELIVTLWKELMFLL